MDRRQLLATAGAALVLPSLAAAQPASPDAQLGRLLAAFFEEALDDSPELATSIGYDKGARAAAKSRLDDRSLDDLAKDRARTAEQLRRLKAVDREALSGMAAVNYDTIAFLLEGTDEANRRFKYGAEGVGYPYALSQLSGAYQDVPDFLGSQHVIETKADADAYLARLDAFAAAIDQDIDHARHDVGLGVIPPDFAIAGAIAQTRGLRVAPDKSSLVSSVADRVRAKGITGDYAALASAIYAQKVVPALDRQIAYLESLQPKATHEAGVGRLPDGEAYYEMALRRSTTTPMPAEEVHKMGLDEARRLGDRADLLLKAQGLTKGSVGERIRALYDNPAYRYANTDAAKVQLIADLNVKVREMQARLPQMFATLPRAPVEIRRVPPFIEAGAPGGYYNAPTLDGSRPGIYWINLRDTAEWPRWTLPTLTYHEAIPGHHLQLSLQQEADLPMLRRITFLSAYGEGWALYAEELAREMGVYENDPLGELGYLQSSLFRSARLVVDTGLHAMRWSREKAIETMTSIDGSLPSSAATEIERYCVWPGQACSYMVGKLTWLRLREAAKARQGGKFDLKAFHDAGLLAGAMPLTVLARRMTEWAG